MIFSSDAAKEDQIASEVTAAINNQLRQISFFVWTPALVRALELTLSRWGVPES